MSSPATVSRPAKLPPVPVFSKQPRSHEVLDNNVWERRCAALEMRALASSESSPNGDVSPGIGSSIVGPVSGPLRAPMSTATASGGDVDVRGSACTSLFNNAQGTDSDDE